MRVKTEVKNWSFKNHMEVFSAGLLSWKINNIIQAIWFPDRQLFANTASSNTLQHPFVSKMQNNK